MTLKGSELLYSLHGEDHATGENMNEPIESDKKK